MTNNDEGCIGCDGVLQQHVMLYGDCWNGMLVSYEHAEETGKLWV